MPSRPSRAIVLVVSLVAVACETTTSPPPSSTPATSSPLVAASAPTAPLPSASASASIAGSSCLMTHICGCNVGCARIPVEAAALREGLRATAQTGVYSGKELIVMKEVDATGASVFALSDRDRSHPCERGAPETKSLMAFLCATKDSGPVPSRACARGCD